MTGELQAQVDELRGRVERLEGSTASTGAPAQSADTFWALDGLRARRDDHPETAAGIVMLTGSLTLPTGEPVEWQVGAATEDLIETDWSDTSSALAALGHPVRLELLRAVLGGVRSTAELAESLGSTGQLHHHLKQLVATGWLAQRGRGTYEVPPTRVVPLLVIVAGVAR
jgi:DNA-binding transcriptional ArsR family regulator